MEGRVLDTKNSSSNQPYKQKKIIKIISFSFSDDDDYFFRKEKAALKGKKERKISASPYELFSIKLF